MQDIVCCKLRLLLNLSATCLGNAKLHESHTHLLYGHVPHITVPGPCMPLGILALINYMHAHALLDTRRANTTHMGAMPSVNNTNQERPSPLANVNRVRRCMR